MASKKERPTQRTRRAKPLATAVLDDRDPFHKAMAELSPQELLRIGSRVKGKPDPRPRLAAAIAKARRRSPLLPPEQIRDRVVGLRERMKRQFPGLTDEDLDHLLW